MNKYIEYRIKILTKAKSKIDQEIMRLKRQLKKEKRENSNRIKSAA